VAGKILEQVEALRGALAEVDRLADELNSALLKLSKLLERAEPAAVRVSSQYFDYAKLAVKLSGSASSLEAAAKKCRAVAQSIEDWLKRERKMTLKKRLVLSVVMEALESGCRTAAEVKQYLEREGVFLSEDTVKLRLRELVKLGFAVRARRGVYVPTEVYVKEHAAEGEGR